MLWSAMEQKWEWFQKNSNGAAGFLLPIDTVIVLQYILAYT